ncbi:MAG: DNA primase, partial [Planktomarina sp.]
LQFFRMQLNRGGGADARAYLTRRGLSEGCLDRFGIGFAPDGWQVLWDHLITKGVTEDLILAAGLAKPSTKGGKPYDTFRNRIMFPIRDARGRCIAFGGRAMDPNDNAKYLNSPETELFDKGRNLYNFGPAREASGKGQPVIVAEGYMDVIALVEAGFEAAVAPLGTAVTENQLQLLWRIADEPIVALDGDTAGVRAALRMIDLALPLLEAGRSLRFAMMPQGQDPDDVLQSGGKPAMGQLLDEAKPMVDLLWDRETNGKNFDSPERKAALDKALREKLRTIKDPSIRGHYGEAIKSLRWALFRPVSQTRKKGASFVPFGRAQTAQETTKNSTLASDMTQTRLLREAVILACLFKTPKCLDEAEIELEKMQFSTPDYMDFQAYLLRYSGDPADMWDDAVEFFGQARLESLLNLPHVRIAPGIRQASNPDFVSECLAQEFAIISADDAHNREVAEAVQDFSDVPDEGVIWRLAQSAKSVLEAGVGQKDDKTEYTTADNGLKVKLEERNALDDLLGGIKFSKPGQP